MALGIVTFQIMTEKRDSKNDETHKYDSQNNDTQNSPALRMMANTQ
jgi:hypothetical protein